MSKRRFFEDDEDLQDLLSEAATAVRRYEEAVEVTKARYDEDAWWQAVMEDEGEFDEHGQTKVVAVDP